MIGNLRLSTTVAWRLKVRVTRMWRSIDRYGQTVAINMMIFVDELVSQISLSYTLCFFISYDITNCGYAFLGRTNSCKDSCTEHQYARESFY